MPSVCRSKPANTSTLGRPSRRKAKRTRAILQRMADEFHQRFRQLVVQQRPQLAAAPPEVFDGRVFTARQALDLRLVDSIGYLDQAAEMVRHMGNAPGRRWSYCTVRTMAPALPMT